MKTPVLVLGMHRSGTSFLASVLRALGVHLGEELLEADSGNPRGYFENRDFLDFHEKLLASRVEHQEFRSRFLTGSVTQELNAEEEQEADRLIAQHSREGLWGWKDPRTSLFLDYWLNKLPDARIIAIYRHPLEVYFSFLKRSDWAAVFAPSALFEAYAAYNEAILRAVEQHGDRVLLLNCERTMLDPAQLAGRLRSFLNLTDEDRDLPEFVQSEFSKLGIREDQHWLMAQIHPEAATVYDRLQSLVETPEELQKGAAEDATLTTAILDCLQQTSRESGHLHPLIDALCLNAPAGKIAAYRQKIIDQVQGEHRKLSEERNNYLELYQRYSGLYENYYKSWQGTEATLEATRRWIYDELMPLAKQADTSEGRRQQAVDIGRQLMTYEQGPLDRHNIVRRHQPFPREHVAFDELLNFGNRQSALGATSLSEQLYAEWVASCADLSSGAVVDLGSWLGSFAVSLSLGASRNPTAQERLARNEKLIHAYDIFEWHPSFEGWVQNTPHANRYSPGDDFRDAFAAEVGAHGELIEVHKSDLTRAEWNGGPIALIINDAWKMLSIASSTVAAYFPHLVGGKTVLLHQDYLWCTESFIHVVMYRLRDYFEPVYQVPNGTTCAFICKKSVPAEIELPQSYDDISPEEIDDAFLWSSTFLDDLGRQVISLGQAWLYAQKGMMDRAREAALPVLRGKNSAHGFITWQVDGFKAAGFGQLIEP